MLIVYAFEASAQNAEYLVLDCSVAWHFKKKQEACLFLNDTEIKHVMSLGNSGGLIINMEKKFL